MQEGIRDQLPDPAAQDNQRGYEAEMKINPGPSVAPEKSAQQRHCQEDGSVGDQQLLNGPREGRET